MSRFDRTLYSLRLSLLGLGVLFAGSNEAFVSSVFGRFVMEVGILIIAYAAFSHWKYILPVLSLGFAFFSAVPYSWSWWSEEKEIISWVFIAIGSGISCYASSIKKVAKPQKNADAKDLCKK